MFLTLNIYIQMFLTLNNVIYHSPDECGKLSLSYETNLS